MMPSDYDDLPPLPEAVGVDVVMARMQTLSEHLTRTAASLTTLDRTVGDHTRTIASHLPAFEKTVVDGAEGVREHVGKFAALTRWNLKIGSLIVLLAALLAGLVSWGSLWWERAGIEELKTERIALLAQIDTDSARADKLRLRGAGLIWTTCNEERGWLHRPKVHRCFLLAKANGDGFHIGDDIYAIPEGY